MEKGDANLRERYGRHPARRLVFYATGASLLATSAIAPLSGGCGNNKGVTSVDAADTVDVPDGNDAKDDRSLDGVVDRTVDIPLPGCLAKLFEPCPFVGECRSSSDAAAHPLNGCFEGGVTFTAVPGSWSTTKVFKSDGTLCYSLDVRCGTFCESTFGTWSNANGQVVATDDAVRGIADSYQVTCSDGGTTTTCERPRDSCPWQRPYEALVTRCAAGACP